MQIGVILIAAILWFDVRRHQRQRRQWLLRNIEAVLRNDRFCRTGENYLTRAA
jgi:Ni/Co efflux regulator RcnB